MKICFEGKRGIREIKEQVDEASGCRSTPSVPAAPKSWRQEILP